MEGNLEKDECSPSMDNMPEYQGSLDFGDFIVGTAKSINVLLVGRSQTGKSTIVETLVNPRKGKTSKGFSDTRDPLCTNLTITKKSTGMSYHLKIIDTPGLQEVRENDANRTNEEVFKLASKFVEENITSLNVVCFVSKAGDTHRLDTEAFNEIRKYLGNVYSKISLMVLTHCDEFCDESIDVFIEDIRTHETSRDLFSFCMKEVARFGALAIDKLESNKPQIRDLIIEEKLDRIKKFRDDFLNQIISCADVSLKIAELSDIQKASEEARQESIRKGIKKEKEKAGRGCSIQ